MFFIFGWGQNTNKNHGPTLPITCPNCHNDTVFHLVEYKQWFTLFFIPVIPYESKNLLLCPVCSRGVELNSAQLTNAKHLNSAAKSLRSGEISEAEYQTVLASIPSGGLAFTAKIGGSIQNSASTPVSSCPKCNFKSFNSHCTICPNCKQPLQPFHPQQV